MCRPTFNFDFRSAVALKNRETKKEFFYDRKLLLKVHLDWQFEEDSMREYCDGNRNDLACRSPFV